MNRVYFGGSGDDGIEGRGGDYVHEPEQTYCDECDEPIVGLIEVEHFEARGRKYSLTFCSECFSARKAVAA